MTSMADNKYHHPQEDQFRKWGVPLPEYHTHGTETDLESLREQLMPNEWHLEGNELVGKTLQGHVIMQRIPTNYILTGTDSDGLPMLREITL